MNTINSQLVQNFFADYLFTEKELARPKEDVVSLSVCITVKSAMHKLLMLYLQSKSGTNGQSGRQFTFQELIKLCSQHNPLFSSVDYSPLLCRCEPRKENVSEYCISVRKTQECFLILKQIKEIVFNELKIKV